MQCRPTDGCSDIQIGRIFQYDGYCDTMAIRQIDKSNKPGQWCFLFTTVSQAGMTIDYGRGTAGAGSRAVTGRCRSGWQWRIIEIGRPSSASQHGLPHRQTNGIGHILSNHTRLIAPDRQRMPIAIAGSTAGIGEIKRDAVPMVGDNCSDHGYLERRYGQAALSGALCQ